MRGRPNRLLNVFLIFALAFSVQFPALASVMDMQQPMAMEGAVQESAASANHKTCHQSCSDCCRHHCGTGHNCFQGSCLSFSALLHTVYPLHFKSNGKLNRMHLVETPVSVPPQSPFRPPRA
jgi:hypothetical protein